MTDVTPWAAANDLVPFQFQELAWKHGAFIQSMSLSQDKGTCTVQVYDGFEPFDVELPTDSLDEACSLLEITLKFRC